MEYSFKSDTKSIGIVLESLIKNINLNTWERSFIDNINNQFVSGIILTNSQMSKLSDIWEKY